MLRSAWKIQRLHWLFVGLMAVSLLACSEKKAAVTAAQSPKETWTQKAAQGEEIFAHMKTSEGDIVLRLFSKEAPKTVQNFVGLATGEKKWTNPATGQEESKPLYPGTLFHRVISGFMIQGGDPLGTGRGDPGYMFENEDSGHKFDKPGVLGMANKGRDTNGSQFFITVAPQPNLDGGYTIFGEVVEGMDVVQKIADAPRSPTDRPNEEVRIVDIKLSQTATPPAK